MRAVQIYIWIMCINAAIGLINMSAIFDETYINPDESDEYDYQVEDLQTMAPKEPTFIDYTLMTLHFLWESICWLGKFLLAFFFIYPTLVDELMLPVEFAAALQGVLVVTWILGVIQWKTGKSIWAYM